VAQVEIIGEGRFQIWIANVLVELVGIVLQGLQLVDGWLCGAAIVIEADAVVAFVVVGEASSGKYIHKPPVVLRLQRQIFQPKPGDAKS
jgi:hypothetical protein